MIVKAALTAPYPVGNKFWYARLENPRKYAIGSGDCEMAVITGPDEITANDWAKQITAALNYYADHGGVI